MTAIAFDGRVLASDRGVGHLGSCLLELPVSKIIMNGKRLAGCVGSQSDARVLAEWWTTHAPEAGEDAPKITESDVCLIALERGKSGALYVDKDGRTLPMPLPYSEGSGGKLAFGAMLAGATAVEAVRIACQVDSCTRGPIDYVIVAEDPWVIRQVPERDIAAVRRDEDGLDQVRLTGRANGGLAPHSPHEGNA